MIRDKQWAENFKKKWGFYPIAGGKGGGKSGAERGIEGAGEQAYQRGKMTPAEETQYGRSFDLGKLVEQIAKAQVGLEKYPTDYLSPTEQFARTSDLARSVYNKTLADVGRAPTEQYFYEAGDIGKELYGQVLAETKDPYAYYQSTLDPQLQLAEDYINRRAQERGLLRSGIPIENMGRAGVELAIKEANARMQARAQALERANIMAGTVQETGLNALQRGAGLSEYLNTNASENLMKLANLYQAQQQYGLNAMGRQANQAQAAAPYTAYPYQAALADVYGKRNAVRQLPGQLIGAAGQIGASYFAPTPTTNINLGG